MGKHFKDFTETEKENLIEKNFVQLHNNFLTVTQQEEIELINEKILRFQEEWEIPNADIRFELDAWNNVTFHSATTSIDGNECIKLSKKINLELEETIKGEIEWYENISGLCFEVDFNLEDEEVDLHFFVDWDFGDLHEVDSVKAKLEMLEEEKAPEIVLEINEVKLKLAFKPEIDEEISELVHGIFSKHYREIVKKRFQWIDALERSLDSSFEALKKEIKKEIDYLFSEKFIADSLEQVDFVTFEEDGEIIFH